MDEHTIDPEMLRALGARVRHLRGHRPLVLDDTRTMWLVVAGTAAVLTSRVEDGLPVGDRRPLFRAVPGTPLFALAGGRPESGERLIVIPVTPLTLYEIRLGRADQALALVGVPLAQAIESWTAKLAEFAASGVAAPRAEPFCGEGRFDLPAGTTLCAPQGAVAWVQVEEGALHLMGSPELRIGKVPVYVPLASSLWVDTVGPTRVLVRCAASIGQARELVRGLALFNSLLQVRLRQLQAIDTAQEVYRLGQRDALHERVMDGALRVLASVLDPRPAPPAHDAGLLGAMALAGHALGVEVQASRHAGSAPAPEHSVEDIARASHLRHRAVRLSGRWWHHDCGPLVGELHDGNRPVALLRREHGGYEIVDPRTGSRAPLDAASAKRLGPRAVMLYKPLPAWVRRPWDLVRFALHGRAVDLAFTVGLGLITTLLGMVTPQATALILDLAIPDADAGLLLQAGFGLLAAAFGLALFGLAHALVGIRIGIAVHASTQAAVWDRLLRLRVGFFKRFSAGDLLDRATSVSEVSEEFNGHTLRSLLTSLLALLNLALLYYYSASLALIALALGALVAVSTVVVGLFVRRYYRALMELQGPFFGLVVQLVHGASKIRVAGARHRVFALWARRYASQLDLQMRAQRWEDHMSVLNQTVPILSTVLLFWLGVSLLAGPGPGASVPGDAAGLTVGVFLAFNTAMGTFLAGATALSLTLLDSLDTLARARRVTPLLEAEVEVDDSKIDPGPLDGEIELSHVDFRYDLDGEQILDDVSVRIHPGEFVAFAGPSGGGKSTIFRLLLGFESPQAGAVYFDGRDLAGLDPGAVRRQLGVVLQTGRINVGSILDNVCAGAPLSLDQVWEAVEDAGFGDDVRGMPMGLHTVISENGSNLSGGQRQRLHIARALAQHPRILLLDEATSALDNRTQAVVSASLVRRKVTRLAIAHRLSTIRDADRIYVLERGRIVETGSYASLVAQGGLFASMVSRQVA